MIDCPFLALSATIGNVEYLRSWLQSLEEARGRDGLDFIEHRKRWNYLHYSSFRQDRIRQPGRLHTINPIAKFTISQLTGQEWMGSTELVPEQIQETLDHLLQLQGLPVELVEAIAGAVAYRNANLGVARMPDMFLSGVDLAPVEQLQNKIKDCVQKLAILSPEPCKVSLY